MATKPKLVEEPVDFSLVLGGPTFQLLRRAHLEGSHLELLYRRLIVITLFAWMPLLLLATFGSLTGSAGRFSFFHDVEVHVRFLVALPILIAAEVIVHSRLRPVVRRFVERRIILQEDLPRFYRAVEWTIRLIPFQSSMSVIGIFQQLSHRFVRMGRRMYTRRCFWLGEKVPPREEIYVAR